MRYDENGNLISSEENHAVDQELSSEDVMGTGMTNETFDEYTNENQERFPEEEILADRKALDDAIAADKREEKPQPAVAPTSSEPIVEKTVEPRRKTQKQPVEASAGNGGSGGVRPPKNEKKDPQPPTPKKGGFKSGLVGGLVGGLVMVVLGGGALYGYTQSQDTNVGSTNNNTAKNVQTSNISANVTTDTTEAVAKVEDAVVSVVNMANSQGNFLQGGGNSSQSSDSSDLQTQSEGSGVIYKKDGKTAYIVTNNHVIDGSDAIEVILKDGTKVEAKLIGADQWTDLAVLSIPADKVKTVATFGNSDDIKVGEPAIAIGSPLGTNFATSVTQGIVSAKDRSVAMDIDGDGVEDWDMTAIQTDAAINPGNSGGALINLAGQVIGINSMKISQDTVEGMGFAIPSNDVVKIINELQQNGKIVRPVLGVVLRDLSQISEQQQQSVLKLPEDVTEGVVITNVQKDSAAAKGGLEQYDTITEIDGQKITDSVSLRKVIYNLKVGDTVEVKFYRDGKLETAKVTMEAANSI
ncbi:MAG: trypsin-like peptidase domain-containing protein [Carnobacterium sp.]|nr:trypsin-like peptidase domain-containing protein [Carnobacterium maltaromaticum]MDT1945369.1 trypsin-like peptidase domain-containing protein [Carnobacterium maltaromaticum]MDT1999740.1 trypsin-like peptidase domain-containing protein [Carnobacterium maltaromaticum]TFJ32360.1 serine protease [Carnobacterium maltaromaticum]TFJ35710.1 serine protease [Carnobacterium maltaromaticum]TFJ39528.1 serine protease [Carnobacterium maltaromaticum]